MPAPPDTLSQRNVDIGSRVKKGDLLVEIAAPEIQDQIAQTEATLAQNQATLVQAQANLRPRTGDLGPGQAFGR